MKSKVTDEQLLLINEAIKNHPKYKHGMEIYSITNSEPHGGYEFLGTNILNIDDLELKKKSIDVYNDSINLILDR